MEPAQYLTAPMPLDATRNSSGPPAAGLYLWLALIAVALGPVLPQLSRYHGDERFYTDAAITMVETGDYWVPRFLDGRERFLKPILTYWVIAASYGAFGINLFGSRIAFLVAGLALIALTAQLARTLYRDRCVSMLAALVLGSNLQFLVLSVRSTPDVLVCLFVLASLLGFARILFQNDLTFAARLLAYAGAGLAIQTKGLLGALPVVFALGYRALDRGSAVPWRVLLDVRALGVGAGLGLFWYGVVWWGHGNALLDQFFADQVTAKVAFNPFRVFGNWLTLSFAVLRHFFPWTLLAGLMIAVAPRRCLAAARGLTREDWFCLGWMAMLIVVFSFSEMRRTRYLAAGYPFFAVLLARFLRAQWSSDSANRVQRVTLAGIATTLGIAGLGLLLGGFWFGGALAVGGTVWLAVALLSLAATRANHVWGMALGLALVMLAAFSVVECCVKPTFDRPAARDIARRLLENQPENSTVYVCIPQPSYASQLNLFARGRLRFIRTTAPAAELAATGIEPVLVEDSQLEAWSGTSYTFEPIGDEPGKWRSSDLLALWRARDFSAAPGARRITYYLGVSPASDPAREPARRQ